MSDFHAAAILMTEIGGAHMQHIGHAWLTGDPENRAKLERGWADHFEKYAVLCVRRRRPCPCCLESHANTYIETT